MKEQWSPTIHDPRYEVSSMGRVRSYIGGHCKILKCTTNDKGYRVIQISRRTHKVSKLVLETFVGVRPPGLEAEHENRKQYDDRLSNLSWKTHLENMQNRGRFKGSSSGGIPGVSLYMNNARPNQSGKWRAFIKIEGKLKHIGYFKLKKEAARARKNYEKNL